MVHGAVDVDEAADPVAVAVDIEQTVRDVQGKNSLTQVWRETGRSVRARPFYVRGGGGVLGPRASFSGAWLVFGTLDFLFGGLIVWAGARSTCPWYDRKKVVESRGRRSTSTSPTCERSAR
ncbi:MAG TPA: hypothetical protein VGM56_06970 [Byssovorax sp.]